MPINLPPNPRRPAPGPGGAASWAEVLQAFAAFQEAPAAERSSCAASCFAALEPALAEGIDHLEGRHFFLLSRPMAVARLFAQAIRRPALPKSRLIFLLWVESSLLHALSDPGDLLGAHRGSPGEASAELQTRFNRLERRDRELLFLLLVEGSQPDEVAQCLGMDLFRLKAQACQAWRRLQAESPLACPPSWPRWEGLGWPDHAQVAEGE